MAPGHASRGMFQFPRTGMWVETGARDLLLSLIGDLRSGIGNQGGKGQSAIAEAFLRTSNPRQRAFIRTQTVLLEVIGVVGPMPTPRVPTMAGGRRTPGSRARAGDRHPDAEFTCATCSREFCRLCEGDNGDCCNCHFLKTRRL